MLPPVVAQLGLLVLFLPFFGVGQANAQNASAFESKQRHNVQFRYDINHLAEHGIGSKANMYSMEREQKLGLDLAKAIEMQSKLVTDRVVTEYVNRLGQRIVRNSDSRIVFQFKVIESNEINAFALPGGYIYVDTGLILTTDNEAELAGVLAHEVAHVAARHATRRETRMQIWRDVCVPLRFAGPIGPVGVILQTAVFLKFGRDDEREADLLGLEYHYVAGYDPEVFVQFLEKLNANEKEKSRLVLKAFDSHPMIEDRIRRTQEEISSLLPYRDEYVLDTSEFHDIKRRLVQNAHPVLYRHDQEEETSASESMLRRAEYQFLGLRF